MDDSSCDLHHEQNLKQAHEKLDHLEKRLQDFKSEKRAKAVNPKQSNPFPNLAEYLTHFRERQQGKGFGQFEGLGFTGQNTAQIDQNSRSQNVNPNCNFDRQYGFVAEEQFSRKFLEERKNALQCMEQFYDKKNRDLDTEVRELQKLKQKALRDKELLLINNQQLEKDIGLNEQLGADRQWLEKRAEVKKLKQKTLETNDLTRKLEKENAKLQKRKKELRKSIQDCMRTHKDNLVRDTGFR